MEFFGRHVIPPTEMHLDLLQFIATLTYAIHLAFVAMVIGGVGSAMWFTLADSDKPNPRYARFAEDLLRVFLRSRTAVLVLGILPIFALAFVHVQWFVGSNATPLHYLPWILVPVVLGFLVLFIYKRSFPSRKKNIRAHLGLGSLGVFLLLAAYFILMAILSGLQDPERWFRLTGLGSMLLNWNAVWKFLFFLHASFAITGCAILLAFFRWPSTKIESGDAYAGLVRNYGAGLAFAFSFAMPVFYLLYVFTSPDVGMDNGVYLLAAGLMFAVLLAALMLFANLRDQRSDRSGSDNGGERARFATVAFGVFVVVFAVSSVIDQKTIANANQEHRRLLVIEAERRGVERQAELEALVAGAVGTNRGEEIFKGQCMACHRFDSKLVGPPLAQVLPKYKEDPEKLRAFVKSPYKINADYPPMPALGLSDADAKSVAEYVLQELEKFQQ